VSSDALARKDDVCRFPARVRNLPLTAAGLSLERGIVAARNLARTVVEGGRSGYSKLDRQLRNRSERRLRFDAEGNVVSGKVRRGGGREFADRLAPLWRWLGRHVGRGWSYVYHEFCERFDRRTMKGWHLREHLFGLVEPGRFPLLSGPFFCRPSRHPSSPADAALAAAERDLAG